MAENSELGNTKKAVSFLKHFRQGHHNIVAIDPVTELVTGITRPIDSPDIFDFIERNNGKRNLYYSVNEPIAGAPDDKLSKHHIKSINAVWLDADPKKELPFEREKERLAKFAVDLKTGPNPPTYITDSGGGIQAFWLLDKPLVATKDNMTNAESLSRGLAEQYGTDYVQNVDRIMRIPFTVNVPSQRKAKLGRVRTTAKIIHADSPQGKRYSQFDFINPSIKAESETDFAHTDVDMERIKSPLPDDLVQRLKQTLGRDRKAHDLYYGIIEKPSRSEYDFTLTQQLVWDGYSIQEVAHILWHYKLGKNKDLTKREIVRTYNRVDNPFEGLDAEYIAQIDKQVNPILAARAKGLQHPDDLKKKPLGSFTTGGDATFITSGEALYKGLINRKTLSVFYGPSGSGKSFLVLDMAVHLAMGKDWAGFKCKGQMAVLYLSLESGASFGKRVVAARQRCNVPTGSTLKEFPFAFYDKKLNLRTNADHIAFIEKMVDDLEAQSGLKCGMIVVDTLSAGFAGGDENTKDMTEFVDTLQLLAEKKQATVTIVHHTGKDEAAGARGHSSLKANIDTEIRIRSEKKGERYLRSFESDKQKDGPTGGFTKFGLNTVELGKDTDGDIIDTCHIVLESDPEFTSIVPSDYEGLEKGEIAVLKADEVFSKLKDKGKTKLTDHQIKILIHNDIKNGIGVLSRPDGTLNINELSFMAVPTKTLARNYSRDCEKLEKKDLLNRSMSGFDDDFINGE